ncbi:glutamine amidotransferase [Herbaspirillum rubrisubalbicans]|uniref:Glutamine amidotransferase n=1 Tax=Herbaspirillum rubrisubalbicans TaxID=80842 RepID=A0AAD0XFS1_9BURK|nr:glutamine amidotransferase [Herbaspirillum rubrisubalbicans]AYR22775.1 glutamine amidotransferase [Herbaspirillum rubrisubalbicans]
MKTAIAIRHVHFEDLGILHEVLREQAYALTYLDACIDDLDTPLVQQADLLIVLGGPIGAYDDARYPFLASELAAITRRLMRDAPTLGICLGAQLMARALGADVAPMGVKEIGYAPLSLTEAGRHSPLAALEDVPVLHWHGDHFEIPAQATHLAGSALCAQQAFAVGRQVLALQFHLEADPKRIEQWLVGHACELDHAGIDPRHLRDAAQRLGGTLQQAARHVVTQWLAGLIEDEQKD